MKPTAAWWNEVQYVLSDYPLLLLHRSNHSRIFLADIVIENNFIYHHTKFFQVKCSAFCHITLFSILLQLFIHVRISGPTLVFTSNPHTEILENMKDRDKTGSTVTPTPLLGKCSNCCHIALVPLILLQLLIRV